MAGGLALAAAFLVLAMAALEMHRVQRDVEAGRAAIRELTLEDIRSGGGVEEVTAEVVRRLEGADERAHGSIWIRALRPLPVLGDQVRGVRGLTRALAQLSLTAGEAGSSIDGALDGAGSPAGRLQLLDTALRELQRIRVAVEETDARLGALPRGGLLPQLSSAYTATDEALASAVEKLDDGEDLVGTARSLLTGPNRYLVLAGNNAEMTAGSGMPLSVGVAELAGGDITLGDFIPSSELVLREDRVAPPGDLGRLYAPMGIGGDFRGATATPNFPAAASIARDMSARTPLGEVDGVLLIDVVALQGLVEATGPVTVDGIEFDAGNVAEELLNGNYLRFRTASPEERARRTDLQGRVAAAIFEALTTRDVEVTDLLSGLQVAAEGRHLLAWSPDPGVEKLWERLGATGELDPNGLLVSVQNYDGNKLDWYIRPTVDLDVGLAPNGDWRVRLEVAVTNPDLDQAEVGEVVVGPDPRFHFVLLDVHMPGSAYDIVTTDVEGFTTKGEDPPMQARTMIYPIARGETETRTIEFTLPREVGGMQLLPSARIAPVPVQVDDAVVVTDERVTPFTWLAAIPPSSAASPPARVVVLLAQGTLLLSALCLTVSVVRTRDLAARPLDRRHHRLLSASQLLAAFSLVALAIAAAIAIVAYMLNPPV